MRITQISFTIRLIPERMKENGNALRSRLRSKSPKCGPIGVVISMEKFISLFTLPRCFVMENLPYLITCGMPTLSIFG